MERTTFSVADFNATVVHDALPADGSRLSDDIVLGPSGAARTLLHITPRNHVERVWDLGCGCGVQSVIAAQHADYVVATDIDERALEFTRESATLNNVTIDTRFGSLFDPVAGEQFDLVVSNPPFVIGGATQLTHRESPFAADGLTRELLENIPRHLTRDGIAVVLSTWLVTTDDWRDRFNDWIPQGVGVWIALRDVLDVDTYITTWMRDAGIEDESVELQWRNNLQQCNARGVAFGWIVIANNCDFMMFDDVCATDLPTGNEVLTQIKSAQAAEMLTAVDLMTTPFVSVPAPGWRRDAGLDPLLSALSANLLGERLLPEVVADLAAAQHVDEDDLMVLSLVGMKRLVALGLARPHTH